MKYLYAVVDVVGAVGVDLDDLRKEHLYKEFLHINSKTQFINSYAIFTFVKEKGGGGGWS